MFSDPVYRKGGGTMYEAISLFQGVTKRCFLLYLGRPIAPSFMSPNAEGVGGRVAGSQPMSTAVHMEPVKILEI